MAPKRVIFGNGIFLNYDMMLHMSCHRSTTKVLSTLLLVFVAIGPLAARFLVGGLSFQEMFDKADLVVIASAINTKDTTERKKLIDIDVIETTRPDLLQDEVIGVETEFQTRITLKGSKDIRKFLLHHYRLAVEEEPGYGSPNFIRIPSERHGTFLMFLRKEKDGRYAPVTGQFDPAVLSVFEIKDATPDAPVW
jgi:hypothetical protein